MKKNRLSVFHPVKRRFAVFMLLSLFTMGVCANINLIADDILTFSGGAPSADNPDVYIIDMGDFIINQQYTITVYRPQGAEADYPVSIEYAFAGNFPEFSFDEETPSEGVLTFAAGETQKPLSFTAQESLNASMKSVYLMFGMSNRTKPQYQVAKMNFINPNPVVPVTGNDTFLSFGMNMFLPSIGAYMFLEVGSESLGHVEVLENTGLRINRQYLDHEAHPVTISDDAYSEQKTILVKPEQAVGTVSTQLSFLYKMSEDAIVSNSTRYAEQWIQPTITCFTRQADSIMNLKIAESGTVYEQYFVDDNNWGMGNAYPIILDGYQYLEVPPRFGPITTDAANYDIGETVVLSIPVLNSKLLQKIYPNNEWFEHIDITLDGGQTFLNRSYITFDGVNNTITAIGEAVNESGSPKTVFAEILFRKFDPQIANNPENYHFLPEFFVYGANASFTVSTQPATFHEIESFDFVLPENNQVNINIPNVAFHCKVNPITSTYKTGTWTSSDPDVGEISTSGVFTPKTYGKTSITFTSDEVAYRQNNGLPSNDELLIQQFDIYVVGAMPEFYVLNTSNREYQTASFDNDIRLFANHNLKNNAWTVDGEVSVEVIHPEADTYAPIIDAFETTPYMIDEFEALIYSIPFNESTFPKTPTYFQFFEGDSMFTQPYKVVMSVPLKQAIGDTVMTTVFKDTFALHIAPPIYPQVRIIGDSISIDAMSGETVKLKYEIKYLHKHSYLNYREGFSINWGIRYIGGTYENGEQHTPVGGSFIHAVDPEWGEYVIGNGNEIGDPASPPDWLELTDMGTHYNAIMTINYELPKPKGEIEEKYLNKSLPYNEYESFDLYTNIHNSNRYSTYRNHHDEWRIRTHTRNIDWVEKYSTYKSSDNIKHPLSDWEEEGSRISDIELLIETINSSGDPELFVDYLDEHAPYRYLELNLPSNWGEMVVGVSKKGSTDTIYTNVDFRNPRINMDLPYSGGEYDLILKYPKDNIEKTYTYKADSIANQIYFLVFAGGMFGGNEEMDLDKPVNITYTNGDSIEVKLNKPGNGSRIYFIYEPKGIISDISFQQFNADANLFIGGSVKPRSIGAGTSDIPLISKDYKHVENIYKYRIICWHTNQSMLKLTLVDEETGEKITDNTHINYVARIRKVEGGSGKYQIATTAEVVDYWEKKENFPCYIRDENNQIIKMYDATSFPPASGTWVNILLDESGEFRNINVTPPVLIYDFRTHLESEFRKKLIPAFSGDVIENSSGLVDTSIQGVYFIPLMDMLGIFGGDYVYGGERTMEIIADGYHPKLVTFDIGRNSDTGEIAEIYNPVRESGKQFTLTVPLKKKTSKLRDNKMILWTEKFSHDRHYDYLDNFLETDIRQNRHDGKNLKELGSNSIVTYSRYADLENALLNVTMPIENNWNPENLKLTRDNSSMAPSRYVLISPSEYIGFENTYVNASYRLNDFIDYDETVYPDITYNGIVVAELPGLFNNEVNPAVYASQITQELKDNVKIPYKGFNIASFGEKVDLNKTDKAMKRAESFNFDLPDPLPFSFETRTEGNNYYLRGILSINLLDYVPVVGQANQAMDLAGSANEFDAAFNNLKGSLKMRPKYYTPKMNSVSAFAGIRGYLEGYGKYDPYNKDWEYGINEGGVSLELSANAWVSVPVGPLKMGIGVEGLASATLGMSKPSEEDWKHRVNKAQFDLWLETVLSLDVTAQVSAGIDIGIAGAEVGVRGRAGFSNKNKIVVKPYLAHNDLGLLTTGGVFNVYANMYVFAHAYFLFWSWEDEWKIFDVSKTWYYPDDSTNPYKRSPQLRSLSSVYQPSTLSMPNSIITNVAANAYPRYFGDGNSLLFSNLKTATNQNDDRISVYYSPNNTSDLLSEATLPSFSFDVASSPSGTTVVAFEQMSDSIRPMNPNISQESYIKTQSGNVDIYATIKNGNNLVTKQLSDVNIEVENKKTDMTPKTAISADGTTAAVVWKSGLTTIDDLGAKLSGSLLMSRYDGTNWSEPITLMSADNLGDYSLAIDGDSVVVATMRTENVPSEENPEEYDVVGKVRLLYVDSQGSVSNIETGMVGRKPQITHAGDNYYVSFMSSYAQNDTTNVNDVYMLPITKNGQSIDDIPAGFVGMINKVSFDYKLVGDHTANSVDDLAILYNASKVVGEGNVETSLYAAKFGVQDNSIFASEPQDMLTLADDGTQLLISFDGYKAGNNMKAAAVISNNSHGAIVVEESTTFENKIKCLSEAYNLSEARLAGELNIEFYVQNSGYLPVNSLVVAIDGETSTSVNENILPGNLYIAKATHKAAIDNTDPVNYMITATFADNSTHIVTGTLDLTSYQMNVNLVSLKSTDSKNIAVVEIQNTSTSPLTAQHEATIGIYKDIFGEELYPGTSLKTIPASELYGDDGRGNNVNKNATVGFDLPVVEDVTSVYAIAKVKKNNMLHRANGTMEEPTDVEQPDKTYATIQLFPTRSTEGIGTGLKPQPEDDLQDADPNRVYPNPTSDILNVKHNLDQVDRIEILDLSGRLIMSDNMFNGSSIDVSALAEGVYLLKLINSNETLSLKFNKK